LFIGGMALGNVYQACLWKHSMTRLTISIAAALSITLRAMTALPELPTIHYFADIPDNVFSMFLLDQVLVPHQIGDAFLYCLP